MGKDFLSKVKRPRGKQWNNKDFWCKAIPDMMTAYNSVCAYSSLWIKPDQPTIDHFISRDENPNLAYEWSNFRLARWRINTRKRNHKDVLDPFSIGEDWFVLEFATFELKPNFKLSPSEKKSVTDTIKRLDLNHRDYVEVREFWYKELKNNFAELKEKAPFIAYEMVRQGLI